MNTASGNRPQLEVGFHTGGFNSAYFSFPKTVEWARTHGVHGIECGFLDGVSWNHGLGYFPHLAAWEDPVAVREMLDRNGVALSQIDAAFPISGRQGCNIGVPYVINTIRWAAMAGCPMVDTTDGLYRPEDMSDQEAMDGMRRCYEIILENAERYGIIVNIETHGYFTANPDRMEEMLDFVDSRLLQMTFDTGNVYIAGQNPVAYLKRFIGRVAHLHVKDVAPVLAETSRGKQTGIGMSHSAIGEGVNADNIRDCLSVLKESGFSGAVSLECDAGGGPVLERSLKWFADTVNDLGYENDLTISVTKDE
jgi:sugar phosphate isomerase/epimerase